MTRVLAITGTWREAGVLRRSGIDALAIGGQSRSFEGELQGVAGIVSFGMAGALDPDLRIGDWVIGERLCGKAEAECDPLWRAALARALPGARAGAVYADGRLIGDPVQKQALHASQGAIAADMESHIAAEAAHRAGVPFAVLRCISDEAAHALPPAVAVAMRPDGGLALGPILMSVIKQPDQIIGITQISKTFIHAYRALRQGVEALPPGFAFALR